MARIITVTNKKGGCGKTTTSVNLAAALAIHGKKVLIIDLDPQAHATYYLRVDGHKFDDRLAGMFSDAFSISRIIERTDIPNLFLVPATEELYDLDELLAKNTDNLKILSKRLAFIKDDFHYIIIDTPAHIGMTCLNAMIAATELLIPLQAHFLSFMALKEIVSVLKKTVEPNNPHIKATWILPTMVDGRERAGTAIIEEARAIFQDKVLSTVIRKSVKLQEAPRFRKPIIIYEPYSPGASDYYALAKEIISQEKTIF